MKPRKNHPIKVGQFSKISVISESFPFCQTIQTEEFMFSNVAYRSTVYGTGICTMHTYLGSSFRILGDRPISLSKNSQDFISISTLKCSCSTYRVPIMYLTKLLTSVSQKRLSSAVVYCMYVCILLFPLVQ